MKFIISVLGYTIGWYVAIVIMVAMQTFMCGMFAAHPLNQLCPMTPVLTR
jgi:uncharacterized phage infection (PIP) family protein YhgE